MRLADKSPAVSVCIVTYNQERFVRQCLQSIVDQETTFRFDVIVADDCSTDNTREVLREFEGRHPGLVKVIIHEKNIGALANYKLAHKAATGEFVAHLDGDDAAYPGKLQRQVEFLRAHPRSVLVAHRMAIFEDGRRIGTTPLGPPELSLEALLLSHPAFVNSSIMYRRQEVQSLFAVDEPIIDFFVYVHCAKLAPLGVLSDVLGKYNANVGISRLRKLMPHIQRAIDIAQPAVSGRTIVLARRRQYFSYARASLIANETGQFKEFAAAGLKLCDQDTAGRIMKLCGYVPNISRSILIAYKVLKRLSASVRS